MPGGDGTGPAGFGPRTGRGTGYCSGFGASGYINAGFGRPFGAGRGSGRGRGRGFCFWFRRPGFWSLGTMPFAVYGPRRPAAYRVR